MLVVYSLVFEAFSHDGFFVEEGNVGKLEILWEALRGHLEKIDTIVVNEMW